MSLDCYCDYNPPEFFRRSKPRAKTAHVVSAEAKSSLAKDTNTISANGTAISTASSYASDATICGSG